MRTSLSLLFLGAATVALGACNEGVDVLGGRGGASAATSTDASSRATGAGGATSSGAGGGIEAATPIVTGLDSYSYGIAVDATYVYWTSETGGVSKVAKTGGAVVKMDSTKGQSFDIAVDATNVYWIGNYVAGSGVFSMPLAGGTSKLIGTDAFDSLVQTPSALYWGGQEAIWRLPQGSSTPEKIFTLGSNIVVGDIAVSGSDLFWCDLSTPNIRRMGVDGTGDTVVGVAAVGPYFLTVGGGSVWWTDSSNELGSVPFGGGVTSILTDPESPVGVAADDSTVYWTNHDGSVKRRSLLDGSIVTLVAAGGIATKPSVIAMDADYLYYPAVLADNSSAIMKTAR